MNEFDNDSAFKRAAEGYPADERLKEYIARRVEAARDMVEADVRQKRATVALHDLFGDVEDALEIEEDEHVRTILGDFGLRVQEIISILN